MKYLKSKKWTTELTAVLILTLAALMIMGQTVTAELEIPAEAEWSGSGHNDLASEAFVHWDVSSDPTQPPTIPTGCAKCHSSEGIQDFLGADGTAVGSVENPVPAGPEIDININCVACHNDATKVLDSVVFPSGLTINGLGSEAICMQCHQGRESTLTVNDYLISKNVVDDDMADSNLGFRNVHYFPAAGTQYGAEAMVGYQYDGKVYDTKFAHAEGVDTCIDCHDQHSLEVKVDGCIKCHEDVTTVADLDDIRSITSTSDHDGDGDTTEGIAHEIDTLKVKLYAAIQDYGLNVAGAAIAYESHTYPYFFNDTDGNGVADPSEANFGNQYKSWTARLVKAAYNYQFVTKDTGGYAHNGKYVIQLLFDSIDDLNPALTAGLTRDDHGHFEGTSEAFRHWDGDLVPGSCSKCHSAGGLPLHLATGGQASQPPSNGLKCETCHDALPEFTRYSVEKVEFPSGAMLSLGTGKDSNLCLNCHQGRESTVDVRKAVAGLDEDTISSSLGFLNVHYYATGATMFGTEAKGAYEYIGKAYNGLFLHITTYNECTDCHDAHSLEIVEEVKDDCLYCHDASNFNDISRGDKIQDFDGDGKILEGIGDEIATMKKNLYTAIQSYATTEVGMPIIYDSHTYPYFFNDTNGNGVVDGAAEANYGNQYKSWTPRLLKAAYNYQFVSKDTGSHIHNGRYIIQVLYDSLGNLGTHDMTNMVRPELDTRRSNPKCGDMNFPMPLGDFTGDCIVGLDDFAIFVSNWLNERNP
ncbi:MAG: hypothetical protein K9M57_01975 [Phycisphaerae bacterium]|nr:hypothetical protein [Phycisphaerae bacterium]